MENSETTVNILGETWSIVYKDKDPAFEECGGYCDSCTRSIVVENIKLSSDPLETTPKGQLENQKRIVRHEIIHAFLFESGLADSSNISDAWAVNEEMVDWIALQFPKIAKVYKELKLL